MNNHLQNLVGSVLPQTENVQPEVEVKDPVGQPAPVESNPDPSLDKDASPETPAVQPEPSLPADPQSVPLPIFMELKHDIRDVKGELQGVRDENALLRQQIAAGTQSAPAAAPAQPQVDPRDAYVEAHMSDYDDDPEQVPIPLSVHKQHEAFVAKQNQAQTQSAADAERTNAINLARRTWTDQKMGGTGISYNAVMAAAEHLLTDGDIYDAQIAGPNAPTVLYRQAIQRLSQSGTPEGIAIVQQINAALNPQQTTTTKNPAPAAVPAVPDAGDKPPTREEVLKRTPTLANLGLLGKPDDEAA